MSGDNPNVDNVLDQEEKKENKYIEAEDVCCVCLNFPSNLEFNPCLHACCCLDCTIKLVSWEYRCPLCRGNISTVNLLESDEKPDNDKVNKVIGINLSLSLEKPDKQPHLHVQLEPPRGFFFEPFRSVNIGLIPFITQFLIQAFAGLVGGYFSSLIAKFITSLDIDIFFRDCLSNTLSVDRGWIAWVYLCIACFLIIFVIHWSKKPRDLDI